MKLSETIYPNYKDSLIPAENAPSGEDVIMFFLPSDFFDDCTNEQDFEELDFEVPMQFVIDTLNRIRSGETWTKEKVLSWRENDWLWEEANDILYYAIEQKKLVSFVFL